jgi:ASC-1-like (ASCH) protein
MIVRAFSLSSSASDNFPDVSKDSYYYDAIAITKSLGISKGDGTNFNPENNVTIEEAIALIERSLNIIEDDLYYDVDIESLYSDSELSDYATRGQIAEMLYYVLTGDTDFDDDDDDDDDDTEIDTIEYSVDSDDEVTFDEDDFIDEFEDATGDDLYRVKFTLPSSSRGTLYYDYESSSDYDSKVSASKSYYADDDPAIDDVTFVPKSSYDGTVTITYKAYDDDGDYYYGTIDIDVDEVDDDDTEIDTIEYSVDSDDEVTFDVDDFTDEFEDATDDDLYRVKFTLPSSSYGTLYYDYESSSDYDSKVSASKSYYADDDPAIDDVTFVPKSSYDGTVTITYKAYDDDGDYYYGTIDIDVDEVDDDDTEIDTIEYSVDSDDEVTFDVDDFTDEFEDATDDDLYRVKFTLPSSSYGKLYYDYESSSDYDSLAKSTSSYYVDDDPAIDDITFVPSSSYEGTVTISYKAYNDSGQYYLGSIEIEVED